MERACREAFRLGFWSLLKATKDPNERPPAARNRKADLRGPVKGQLELQFTGRGLTSYAGVEILRHFLHLCRLNRLLRKLLRPAKLRGDYGLVSMIRLILILVIVDGRRLRHVDFLR